MSHYSWPLTRSHHTPFSPIATALFPSYPPNTHPPNLNPSSLLTYFPKTLVTPPQTSLKYPSLYFGNNTAKLLSSVNGLGVKVERSPYWSEVGWVELGLGLVEEGLADLEVELLEGRGRMGMAQ